VAEGRGKYLYLTQKKKEKKPRGGGGQHIFFHLQGRVKGHLQKTEGFGNFAQLAPKRRVHSTLFSKKGRETPLAGEGKKRGRVQTGPTKKKKEER